MNDSTPLDGWIITEFVEERLRFSVKNGSIYFRDLDPKDDFLSQFMQVCIKIRHHKLNGFYVLDIESIPHVIFAKFRECAIAVGAKLLGSMLTATKLPMAKEVDLTKSEISIQQWKYEDGTLAGTEILKYGWYDEKFHQSVRVSDRCFEIYGKVCINQYARIELMGELQLESKDYLDRGCLDLDEEADAKGRLDRYLERHSYETADERPVEVAKVRYLGFDFAFPLHSKLKNMSRIVFSEKTIDEVRHGLLHCHILDLLK